VCDEFAQRANVVGTRKRGAHDRAAVLCWGEEGGR
jgi:hypothetical protein